MKSNNRKAALSTLLLLVTLSWSYAHALYIETSSQGKAGQRQEVKVYYSEFADGTVEKVADWYSDVKEFQLWLVHPDGQKTALETTAQEDHFTANSFRKKKELIVLESRLPRKNLEGKIAN